MIRFILNDHEVSTDAAPSDTLLDYIRYTADLRGTKIGCREGDCGACTVLSGRLRGNGVFYEGITSCLTPLANANGKHIVTIEGLNTDGLNRVQENMVNCSGTQCGICTPGFVVSFCGYVLNPRSSLSKSARDAVDGNICRCTGYKSIERAAGELDRQLSDLKSDLRLEELIEGNFIPSYFRETVEKLRKVEPPDYVPGGRRVVGGGTDLYVQKPDEIPDMEVEFPFYYREKKGVWVDGDICTISGVGTATDLMDCKELSTAIPGWYGFMKLVSSTPIRNIGTIAGNLVNASPIGDLTILLLALDAELVLKNREEIERNVPLRSFYKGYKKMDMQESEWVDRISFSIPDEDLFNFEKVSKRKYLDIASVNSAIRVKAEGRVMSEVSCSIGGVAAVPLYLERVSAFLKGKEIEAGRVLDAVEILQKEISPISDARGSADYKRLLASQLFKAHFISLFPTVVKMEHVL